MQLNDCVDEVTDTDDGDDDDDDDDDDDNEACSRCLFLRTMYPPCAML